MFQRRTAMKIGITTTAPSRRYCSDQSMAVKPISQTRAIVSRKSRQRSTGLMPNTARTTPTAMEAMASLRRVGSTGPPKNGSISLLPLFCACRRSSLRYQSIDCGHGDPRLVEAFLDAPCHVEMHGPVACIHHPHAYRQFDRPLAKCKHADKGFRLGKAALICGEFLVDDGDSLRDVIGIRNAEFHVEAARRVKRKIADRLTPDLAVRHDDLHIIGGGEFRGEKREALYRARDIARVNIVAGAERTEDEQHHPGSDIVKRALKRKANCKARRAQHRNEAR